ncbi:hypothetical protein EG799_04530 [Aurantiacibacter spongiae]|uniref:Uncharacterized protein n=1 Tax=Aurantiacibacter spongiae TaxID=2488860 RepID=A0A3N5DJR0_9SPHN|nr:hypothetical protein EG799_04530 [Aurantiacibacter spongiae]
MPNEIVGWLFLLICAAVPAGLTTYVVLRFQRWQKCKPDRIGGLIATIPDFEPVLRFDQADKYASLAMDPDTNQFAVILVSGSYRVFHFSQLVAVEIERDGTKLELTNRGSQLMGAAVGGALLGPVGLLLGGLSGSKRHEQTVKNIALKIFTNDLHEPVIRVTFFNHLAGCKPNTPEVRMAVATLEQWYGRFRTILAAQSEPFQPQPYTDEPRAPGRGRGLLSSGA